MTMSPELSKEPRRLVVGVSGSSSPQFAAMFLDCTSAISEVETHLVMSAGARLSIQLEMGIDPAEIEKKADVVYDARNMGAAVSSGSFKTIGMVVIPCSMRTLAGVATGAYDSLVGRAADVALKERRTLVLVTRETPLNLVHIKNMEAATLAGATILPPVPAFYHRPDTIDDLLRQTCGKVLDQFEVEHDLFRRWTGHDPS
jgi:polyprenyl P-hydroxybenzoate/phenylacrylic acid decarboxylase-like protein